MLKQTVSLMMMKEDVPPALPPQAAGQNNRPPTHAPGPRAGHKERGGGGKRPRQRAAVMDSDYAAGQNGLFGPVSVGGGTGVQGDPLEFGAREEAGSPETRLRHSFTNDSNGSTGPTQQQRRRPRRRRQGGRRGRGVKSNDENQTTATTTAAPIASLHILPEAGGNTGKAARREAPQVADTETEGSELVRALGDHIPSRGVTTHKGDGTLTCCTSKGMRNQYEASERDVLEWLTLSLHNLGYPLPYSPEELRAVLLPGPPKIVHGQDVEPAYVSDTDVLIVDDNERQRQFVEIVRWLEEKCIRFYDSDERKNMFESAYQDSATWKIASFTQYLDEVGFPYALPGSNDGGAVADDAAEAFYFQVLYWMVVCAVSEVYGDVRRRSPKEPSGSLSTSSLFAAPSDCGHSSKQESTTEVRSGANSNSGEDNGGSDCQLLQHLDRNFPLGFTSGDVQVDRALVLTRMIHLLELDDE